MAVKSNWTPWLNKERSVARRTEEVVAGVIITRGTMLAPKLTGDLRNSGRVEKNPNGGQSATFGDSSVPYARRRHYENRKNPGTLRYLERSGDSVKKENIKKYMDMAR